MNKEAKILDTAIQHLWEHTGIKAHWKARNEPIDALLYLENKNIEFLVTVKSELRGYHLPQIEEQAKAHKRFMVVAENIFPTLKKYLRDRGIAYLDAAGNLFYDTDNQYVWVEGNKAAKKEGDERSRAFTKAGLRVVFQFLWDEENLNKPYREIAAAAGVALGNIKYVVDGLRELEFIIPLEKKRWKLVRKRELLDRWMDGYGTVLKPALHIGNFRFLKEEDYRNWKRLQLNEEKTVWGGEPAADMLTNYLAPAVWTLYTREAKSELIKTWKLVPSPEGKVQVYEKFWENSPIKKVAPEVLVYADLMLTNDPRCIEAAQIIYNKNLAHAFV